MYSNKMIVVYSLLMTCTFLTSIEAHNDTAAVVEEEKSGDLLPASPINKEDHKYSQLPYLRLRRNSPGGLLVKVEEITVKSDDLLPASPINKEDHKYGQLPYLRLRRNSPGGCIDEFEERKEISDDLLSGSPTNKGDLLYVRPLYYIRSRGNSQRVQIQKDDQMDYKGSRHFLDILSIKKHVGHYPSTEDEKYEHTISTSND